MTIEIKEIIKAAKLTNHEKLLLLVDLLEDVYLDKDDDYLEDITVKIYQKYDLGRID